MQPSQDLYLTLNLCDKLAQKRYDSLISSELFILASLESRGALTELLKTTGVTTTVITKKPLTKCVIIIKVSNLNTEDQHQTLKKFTINLTEFAEQGKA